MAGASDAVGSGNGGADHDGPVSRQAADDVAQVMRGKHWLQRVVEMAESATTPDAATDVAPSDAPRKRPDAHM